MDFSQLTALGQTFGVPGLMIGFLIWDRITSNAIQVKRAEADIKIAEALNGLGKDYDHLAQLIKGGRQ